MVSKLIEPNLDPIEVTCIQRYIPFLGEVHRRRIGFLILYKTDAHDNLVLVSQEESNRLESAGISGPSSRTRDASREALIAVPMRHTPCKL